MFMTIIIFLTIVALAFAAGWNINGYFMLEKELEKIDQELDEEETYFDVVSTDGKDCNLHIMRDGNGKLYGIGYYYDKD